MPGEFLQLPHGPIYLHDFGGKGAAVVAIHGLGGAHLNWLPVADGLSRYGRVLAPDLPGFGYSPPQDSHRLTIHARALIEVVEAIGGPAWLIGNSLGGLVAMLAAAARPDLVERLTLVAPAAPPSLNDPTIDGMVARRLVLQGIPVLGPEMVRRYWRSVSPARQIADTLAVVCHHPEQVPPAVITASIPLAGARRQQPWAVDALIGSGRAVARLWARRSVLAKTVKEITAPTLVIQGGHDRVIAGSAIDWLMSLRPDWRLEVMPEAGHCPQLESPRQFLALIDRWMEGWEAATGAG
jgi:pimeloyl-ACP methyl ester carboxylesterase